MSNVTRNDSRVHPKELFTRDAYDFLALILATLGVWGLWNNLLILILYFKFRTLRTPTNLLLVHVNFSDLLLCIFGFSFHFASCVSREWIWNEAGCVFVGFCKNVFGNVSIVTITVIAYGRYLQVACNKVIDFPWSWQAIAYIWIYSLAWSSAPLLGWNRYTLELHGLDCSLDQTSQYSSQVYFVLLSFLAFLVAPVSTMAYCYGYILYSIRMLQRQQNYQTGRVLKLQYYEMKVATMCTLMILAFLMFWTPSYIMSLLMLCGYKDIITPTIAVISSVLTKLSTATNPLIYILTSMKFRKGLQKLFCFRCWTIQTKGRKKRVGAKVKIFNACNRPKRVIFSSSSVSFIETTNETDTQQSVEKTKDIYGTNVKIIYVKPLQVPDVLK
ncbi:opsin-3 [Hyla sarda]|uniref:opsin-3 n=1 Tax=Hyla sarda TaxID=327740 RepID=UPI0024C46A04|nr:opsin-3 [Hyla sarda]